ncbi:MAG: hypothetical protein KDA78_20920, partial [Planctomycetaceae bacterium]|nr:hypothetical protein [Planctomycetaceae bacterium]
MRSEVCFVMHPEDEKDFVRIITSEQGVVLVNGPKWDQPDPPVCHDINRAGNYLMIWNPSETPGLTANHHRKEDKEWWYCNNEHLTIQFLRSGFQYHEPYLFAGRIAVCTTSLEKTVHDPSSAEQIERRFKSLRKQIQKTYRNSILIWQNPSLPRSRTNPQKPAPNVWIGPHAIQWLEEQPAERWVQQFRGAKPRGYLVDLV